METKKAEIIDSVLVEELKKMPDLFYKQDLASISPANLVAIMEALDDTSDYINDYLTDNNLGQQYSYPDVNPPYKQ